MNGLKTVGLSGVAASAGVATAPAAMVTGDGTILRGEDDGPYVLVAHFTTPDLTPALVDAAGIVTDEGGVASHAANIARELGIPCVVSSRFATLRISPGDAVTVDGDTGTVSITPRPGCLLCNRQESLWEFFGERFFAIYDGFPVRGGHLLIAPRRHMERIDELDGEDFAQLRQMLATGRSLLADEWGAEGMNLGMNEGAAAGQTLLHLHFHLIPRVASDIPDPRGGVRNLLPDPIAPYPSPLKP